MGCGEECNCGGKNKRDIATYKVSAYIEYEIEATSIEEAVDRLGECIISDLENGGSIMDIAEVNSEKIRDTGIDD